MQVESFHQGSMSTNPTLHDEVMEWFQDVTGISTNNNSEIVEGKSRRAC